MAVAGLRLMKQKDECIIEDDYIQVERLLHRFDVCLDTDYCKARFFPGVDGEREGSGRRHA